MNILDIAIAKQLAGGGGGSGTDNYNDLSNLPKINDTTLSGNKSSSALGLQSEITSDNKLDSDLISDADQDNKFVTSAEKNTWNAKQNAIDADHKINADYVDDSTSTNKFVTASDKEAWNAKQSAIDSSHKLSSDLVDDANHTNKFVTTTEKNTWNAKQNAIDSDHKLSSSLVSFSTAEAAALASGIDSTKVSQISTNQTNILYAINTGAKNLLEFDLDLLKTVNTNGSWSGNVYTYNGVTYTINTDNTVTVSAGSTHAYSYLKFCEQNRDMGNRTRFLNNSPLYLSGAASADVYVSVYSPTGGSDSIHNTSDTDTPLSFTNTENNYNVTISVLANKAVNNAVVKAMIRSQSITDRTYQPFALPNSDLTQEVNALHERTDQIQPVVKFDADVPGWYRVFTLGNTTSVTAKGAYDNSCDIIIKRLFSNTNNEHHEIKLASIFENMGFADEFSKSAVLLIANIRYVSANDNAYIDIYYSGSANNRIACFINNNGGISSWKAVNAISRVPETTTGETVWASYAFRDNYLSPNDPVYIDTGSLNDLTENKLYYAGANVTDKPTSDWGFVRNTKFDSNTGMQEFISLGTSSDVYIRTKVSGTWQAWKQITNA